MSGFRLLALLGGLRVRRARVFLHGAVLNEPARFRTFVNFSWHVPSPPSCDSIAF